MPKPEWMNQYTPEARHDREFELDIATAKALFYALAKGEIMGTKLYFPLHDDLYLKVPRIEVQGIYEAFRTGVYEIDQDRPRWIVQQETLRKFLGIVHRPLPDEEL